MRKLKILICVALLLALTACALGTAQASEGKRSIVCTSFPCYDVARAVAGDRAEIQLLIKPGAEVHAFEPTPSDILSLAGCDLFAYVGGESDAWVTDILSSFGGDAPQTLRFFDCVEGIEAEHDHGAEAEHHDGVEYDEHIWTSPVNACAMVNAMADALCEIDAENEALYRENASAYISEIEALDAQIRDVVANAARREVIFADRFPLLYFAREYSLDWCAAFPSCSSESEPSAKTIAALIDRVVSDGIPVIYVLELSNGRTAQAISAETGAQVRTFYSMQNVTESDFSAGETYVTLMERNIAVLQEGLN